MNDLLSPFFTTTQRDGVAVVAISKPRLSDEDNVEQLGHDLSALVEKLQFRKIALDLTKVEYVNSSVLGKFITLHRKLGRSDGRLIVCGLRGTLLEILETSRLLTYFTTAPDVESAIAMLE